MSSEKDCAFVSSRGILKSCDIHSTAPRSSVAMVSDYVNVAITRDRPFSIYVCNSAIRNFIKTTLPKLTQPFVLVSGDSDTSIPFDMFSTREEFESFIQDPRIIRWYSQNCTISDHPKMVQLPIGLDYHTLANAHNSHPWGPQAAPSQQESMLISLRNEAGCRIPKAYCNFQFRIHSSKFGNDRHEAIRKFPANLTYYEPIQTQREDGWRSQTNYAFVLSPHGNGLDCHRTWEALCLGCIPIVKTSALDPMYEGLPVLILKEWSDATETMLEQKMQELSPLFLCKEKLQLNYWMERIRGDVYTHTHILTKMSGVWDNVDQANYNAHVKRGAGQIDGDEFARDIESLAANTDYRTYLEVGTWNGRGSTMAFRRGFDKRGDDYVFYSLECNADKCRDAQQLHAGNARMHILNEVVWNEEPTDFYEVFPQCLTDKMLKHWNEVDLANMKKCPVFLARPDLPKMFDVVLLDGGEFTTYFEFQMLKDRCRLLLLDDTNVDKCKRIVQELKSDPTWEIVKEVKVRNGFLIAKRVL